jgi:hypothetical protein
MALKIRGEAENAFERGGEKICDFNGQFHQQFTSSFLVQKFCLKIFCTNILGFNFFVQEYQRKYVFKMLVKLTTEQLLRFKKSFKIENHNF